MDIKKKTEDVFDWERHESLNKDLIGKESPFLKRSRTALPASIESLCSEVYNPGPEPVIFENIHPQKMNMFYTDPKTGIKEGPQFWMKIICKPDDWCFLPHALYIGKTPSGRPQACTQNLGDRMFKGEKYPSRPEAKKIRVAGKK